jgi:hypothetical protein
MGHGRVYQRVDGRISEDVEHVGMRSTVGADVTGAEAVVVVDSYGAVGHEVTPVSWRRLIQRELW